MSDRLLNRVSVWVWCWLAGAAVVPAAQAWGQVIPIINPSFEQTSRALLVGEQTNGVGGAGVPVATRFPFAGGTPSWDNPVEVAGWRTFILPPPETAVNRVGVLNPPQLGEMNFIEGQDGQNVLAIQNARCGQVLDHLVQPGTRYRLEFRGGIGLFDSDYLFGVSLITTPTLDTLPLESWPGADVRRLAITSGLLHPPEANGQMLPYVLEYTTPAVLPVDVAGRYLGIHLWGSDGVPRVLYDDFRLEAFAVPGPGTGAAVFLSALVVVGRRRGR